MSRRYPFEPLWETLGRPSGAELARRLGVTPRTLHRWRTQGIPEVRIDEIAIELGYHPGIIWSDWWSAA